MDLCINRWNLIMAKSSKKYSFTPRLGHRQSENCLLTNDPIMSSPSQKSSERLRGFYDSPLASKKQLTSNLLRSPLVQANSNFEPVQRQTLKSLQGKKKQSSTALKISELSYKEHLFHTFQSMKFVKKLPPADLQQIEEKSVYVKKKPGFEYKKTVVFDLDETLVHCPERVVRKPDVVLKVTFPNGEIMDAPVYVRPFAVECLREASKNYEVIVFTASHQCYADAVLNYLDPENKYIYLRLYRESCIQVNEMFIKDLRILKNRCLKNILIVDNATHSFAYQIENGVPIISWHDDLDDKELLNLIEYLQILTVVDDVREINREVFRMHSFYDDYIEQYLKARF